MKFFRGERQKLKKYFFQFSGDLGNILAKYQSRPAFNYLSLSGITNVEVPIIFFCGCDKIQFTGKQRNNALNRIDNVDL